jgi:hypothetical protein
VHLKEQKEKSQPMISLAVVAKLSYLSAIRGELADEETLNNVARAIADCVDVFDCRPVHSGSRPTLVTSDEIRSGHFGGGGMTLNFNDGRSSRTNLCIRVLEVSRVIVEIDALFRSPL